MKIVLSVLVVALALSQAAIAKEKIPPHGTKVVKTQKTPPLDQTVTGGTIAPAGSTSSSADQSQLGQGYPEALDLHF